MIIRHCIFRLVQACFSCYAYLSTWFLAYNISINEHIKLLFLHLILQNFTIPVFANYSFLLQAHRSHLADDSPVPYIPSVLSYKRSFVFLLTKLPAKNKESYKKNMWNFKHRWSKTVRKINTADKSALDEDNLSTSDEEFFRVSLIWLSSISSSCMETSKQSLRLLMFFTILLF